MSKSSIIIVGAGAAGLNAAIKLLPHFNVTILEAAEKAGGRINSIVVNDIIIEAGAEFIHGNLPVTLGILEEAGINYVAIDGEMYRCKNNALKRVTEMTEGWDELLRTMSKLSADTNMLAFLDHHFPAPKFNDLRLHVRNFVEGFDLADMEQVSVKALYEEWSAEEDDNYHIPNGYGAMINFLQQKFLNGGGILHFNNPVTKVHWQKGKVTITSGNQEYTAEKLLVTVPVSILQQPENSACIKFDPPIHFDEKTAGDIGYGQVIKVVVKFNEAFWPKDAGFILSDELFPAWWTLLPDTAPILTGWIGGPRAAEHAAETDETILQGALQSLAAMFDKPVDELKDHLEWSRIFNWKTKPFALGGYSYLKPETKAAQQIISRPLEDTIFFAGEALCTGAHPGTVEAALESGIKVATIISGSL